MNSGTGIASYTLTGWIHSVSQKRELFIHILETQMEKVDNGVSTAKKRSNSVITTKLDGDGMIFSVIGQPDLVLETGKVSDHLRERAMFHGFKQRVSDAAAIPANPKTGKPASASEKWAAMKQIVDHLNSGASEWNAKRAEGGRDMSGLVMQALAVLWKLDVSAVENKLGQLAARQGMELKDVVKRFAGAADVIREVASIKAARAGVDSDELLDELM